MKFTLKQFNDKFPDDDACLRYMFDSRYGEMKVCTKCGVLSPRYYRVKSKKVFECNDCGYQISPLANTILHKSETPLRFWFYAIFMFSVSKNGVSAKELERTFGVTYKCAWRMAKQIRSLMNQGGDKLMGIVEADETYMGGPRKLVQKYENKMAVMGVIERQKNTGRVRALVTKQADATVALPFMRAVVKAGERVHTDESRIYNRVKRDFAHQFINHSKSEYAKDGVTTNTIEGFWSQMKRSIDGTYHCISPKYLQNYVNEFVFRYNLRSQAVFPALVSQASRRVS